MADGPIDLASPSENTISQFGEKGFIKGREVSVSFEGIGEKTIRMAIRLFNLI